MADHIFQRWPHHYIPSTCCLYSVIPMLLRQRWGLCFHLNQVSYDYGGNNTITFKVRPWKAIELLPALFHKTLILEALSQHVRNLTSLKPARWRSQIDTTETRRVGGRKGEREEGVGGRERIFLAQMLDLLMSLQIYDVQQGSH